LVDRGGGSFGAGFRPSFLTMPLVAALLLTLAAPIAQHRDIAVAH
jgi:hypothetical protein